MDALGMMMLPNFGAAVTAAIGCLGLLLPGTVSRVLGIRPEGPLGTAEFRATYGGFFMCLGIGCLVAQSVPVFTVVGAAWCAAALARLISSAVDASRSWHNLFGIGFEAGVGLSMLAAQL
ncbi:MAG: DUF4345 family protein [Pirellulales bacterium]